MTYIRKELRKMLDKPHYNPIDPGELNYKLTNICLKYLYSQAYCGGEPNYRRFNEVIGALECAKQELYRRAVAPYKDKKIEENGDVY
jgi:hypothetical protein